MFKMSIKLDIPKRFVLQNKLFSKFQKIKVVTKMTTWVWKWKLSISCQILIKQLELTGYHNLFHFISFTISKIFHLRSICQFYAYCHSQTNFSFFNDRCVPHYISSLIYSNIIYFNSHCISIPHKLTDIPNVKIYILYLDNRAPADYTEHTHLLLFKHKHDYTQVSSPWY